MTIDKHYQRLLIAGVILAVLFYFMPILVLIFLVCGLIDVARHRRFDAALLSKYFTGNGMLTWLLSPLNLLFDLISFRRPYRLQIADFPESAQVEIKEVLAIFDSRKEEILADLRQRMGNKKRGMLFYKWYGDDVDRSVPEFNRAYTHVKTIGVSVFNSRESTTMHFGPLRLTVRLLYNLTARRSDKIFIEVNGVKHFWHDDPLFIFDDTIQHRSINDEDGERACVFVDLLRPSRFTEFQNSTVRVLNRLLSGINRIFYKNWEMLAQKG